jgi:hypothetical protein
MLEFTYQTEEGERRRCAMAVWAIEGIEPASEPGYTALLVRGGRTLLVVANPEAFREAYLRAKSGWVTVPEP